MQRDELIEMIADVAGPTGPLRSFADQLASRDARVADAPFDDVDGLIALIGVAPPDGIASAAHWHTALVDTLVQWGRRDPGSMLAKLGPLIGDDGKREIVLEIIGGLRDERGIDLLAPLADTSALWSESQRIAFVAALGEIGGARAGDLIDRLTSAPASAALKHEMAIARFAARAVGPARTLPYATLSELYGTAFRDETI